MLVLQITAPPPKPALTKSLRGVLSGEVHLRAYQLSDTYLVQEGSEVARSGMNLLLVDLAERT